MGFSFPYIGQDHALETVIGLIVDDGVRNRHHRSFIFSDSLKFMGAASKRSRHLIVTVIDYSSEDLSEVTGVIAPENRPDERKDLPLPGNSLL